ncbi:MAG: FHA domain-containing protein [Candidatus Binataceae bacterium]
MGARLVVRGAAWGRAEISLSRGRVTIGSTSDNSVVLADKTVSRHHAILEITQDSCTVADAGSTNGTFVNGRRITAATPVHNGDELRFGALKFFFQAEGAPDVGAGPVAPERSWLRHSVAMILALFASAMVVALFVINFSRLITTELEGSKASTSPAAASTPANAVAAPASEDASPQPWLDALNRYRATAGLAAVRSNPSLSPGAKLHSRYIATNYSDQIRQRVNLGGAMHQEDPSKPGFSAAGAAAGLAGDVDEMWDPGAIHESSWAIDNWMLAPFHRLSLLDPRLRNVGYGDYCEAGVCIATLNVHGGVDPSSPPGSPIATVEYPPNGSSIKGADFTAEWPDPLTSCAGYAPPAGLPITLQLGPLVTPIIASYSLTLNSDPSAAVEACGIDANSYVNPDAATQTVARELLRTYGAVIIVPRKSLAPGGYTVTLNASGQDYTWSFTVNP